MKLYYFPLSTYSQKTLMAFHETGIEFEPMIVNMLDPDENAEYRKIYPLGKVPLLILDDGHVIPESSIIIEYLDGISESVKLIPEDPDQARKTRFLDRMYDNYLNNSVLAKFFELRKPDDERSQQVIEQADEKINIMYGYMEKNLANSKWNHGDMFSMADCAAIPSLHYACKVAPFDEYPGITAYWVRAKQRASYQKVLEHAAPYLKAMDETA